MTIGYNATITWNDQALYMKSVVRTLIPRTRKQKVGGNIVKHKIPATELKDYQIKINAVIVDLPGTTALVQRAMLEDEHAAQNEHQYDDGYVVGSYIITDLIFTDKPENPLNFEYRMTLLELNESY